MAPRRLGCQPASLRSRADLQLSGNVSCGVHKDDVAMRGITPTRNKNVMEKKVEMRCLLCKIA